MDGFTEYQTSILCKNIQTIAKLELLLLHKEKLDQRNPYDLVAYESTLRRELRVPSSVLGGLLKDKKQKRRKRSLHQQ
jgi:hypothetical protein